MTTDTTAPRRVDVNIHDTSLAIWQDNPNDPTFQREVYGGLIRFLRDGGWRIGQDPGTEKHFPTLGPSRRYGTKGALHITIGCSGRVVETEVWAETWVKSNPNGHRYDFDKRKRLEPIDRRRLDLLHRRIVQWARDRFDVAEVRNRTYSDDWPRFPVITAAEALTKRGVGRPDAYSRHTADGHELDNGATVYLRDRSGRWIRGTAFGGGGMWNVITGPWSVERVNARQLRVTRPDDLRAKEHPGRRKELEWLLTEAMARLDFERAATLRRVLFGDAALFRIRCIRKHRGSYYASCCSGYSAGLLGAGLYTREEAEAEVARVPSELEMCTVDGKRCAVQPTAPAKEAA